MTHLEKLAMASVSPQMEKQAIGPIVAGLLHAGRVALPWIGKKALPWAWRAGKASLGFGAKAGPNAGRLARMASSKPGRALIAGTTMAGVGGAMAGSGAGGGNYQNPYAQGGQYYGLTPQQVRQGWTSGDAGPQSPQQQQKAQVEKAKAQEQAAAAPTYRTGVMGSTPGTPAAAPSVVPPVPATPAQAAPAPAAPAQAPSIIPPMPDPADKAPPRVLRGQIPQ